MGIEYSSGVTLRDIAGSGSQLVAVGSYGSAPRIFASANGSSWSEQTDRGRTTGGLTGITWTGQQFVAGGWDTGQSSGIVVTSPDGATWTDQTSGLGGKYPNAITWSGNRLVAVGQSGAYATSTCPWGDDFSLTDNRWTMIGLPATPTTATVNGIFSNFLTGIYGTDGIVWRRDAVNDQNVILPSTASVMGQGTGYWLKTIGGGAKIGWNDATATPLTTSANCPSSVGCYAITLATPAADRYNLVGFPLPYPVAWWDARVEVDGTAYTLAAAETAGYLASTYWVWNGNGYDVFDDTTPGVLGVNQPWRGLWVKVLASGVGKTIKLLVPAIPRVSQAPVFGPPANLALHNEVPRLEAGWRELVNWLIPTALASPPDQAPAIGWQEREEHRQRHAKAIQEGREWYVRLIVEEPELGLRDSNNLLGKLSDAAVGYDRHDLPELPPTFTPYLTIVCPHTEWGLKAGRYASDYRPTNRGEEASTWRFEVRG